MYTYLHETGKKSESLSQNILLVDNLGSISVQNAVVPV